MTLEAVLSRTLLMVSQKVLYLCFQEPVITLRQAPRQREPGPSPENKKAMCLEADTVALASGRSGNG